MLISWALHLLNNCTQTEFQSISAWLASFSSYSGFLPLQNRHKFVALWLLRPLLFNESSSTFPQGTWSRTFLHKSWICNIQQSAAFLQCQGNHCLKLWQSSPKEMTIIIFLSVESCEAHQGKESFSFFWLKIPIQYSLKNDFFYNLYLSEQPCPTSNDGDRKSVV